MLNLLFLKVLPELFRAVRMCEDGCLKEFITWKLGTLVSIVRQVICRFSAAVLVHIILQLLVDFSLQLMSSIFY